MDTGARAAISGFRLQALYTLTLILDVAESGRVFQPEGKEDLAIFESEALVRAIQVKAYSTPLKFSDLQPQKENSFLRRISNLDSSCIPQLVSFGPLGPELTALQRRETGALQTIEEKLESYSYSASEIQTITRRLEIIKVDEINLHDKIYRSLIQTMTAGEPDRAFDLLVWWILQAAENRHHLTFQSLRDKIVAIGRYLAERSAHHDEWFTSIKPLDESIVPVTQSANLADEYYRGAAARYSHINAGLDIRRPDQLQTIQRFFSEKRKVVILHGASGQGKTSLALRYLHDYVPAGWRFMVTAVDDRRHATRIANALADHLRTFNAPMWIFIDVAPRDLQWVALVRELIDIDNAKIIVAIREEDLARRIASESEIGFPADIRLDFSIDEAEKIYNQLVEQTEAVNAFPTFAEAWERFGGEGPLLEFVHLVTQTKSLRSVLASQVRRLREEVRSGSLEATALKFLHICAIATSFEAHINISLLAAYLGLKDPVGTLAIFENEFLLRVSKDRAQIEALHPVRSDFLAKELEDSSFSRATEVALQSLPYIPELDLEIFLLYLLSRIPDSWAALPKILSTLKIKSAAGAAGVSRALLWQGMKAYLETNRSTIRMGGDSWAVTLLPDPANASETDIAESITKLIEENNPEAAETIRQIRQNLTPKTDIFQPLANWLAQLGPLEQPVSLDDWEGVAELTFWCSRLNIPNPAKWTEKDLLEQHLPVEVIAELSLALADANPERQRELVFSQDEEAIIQFREHTDTFILAEEEESVTSLFIVPLNLLSNSTSENPQSGNEITNATFPQEPDTVQKQDLTSRLNAEAVRRAELLRSFFPTKERYCTQGIGHKIIFDEIGISHDPTVKHMPPTAMPIPWLVQINSTMHNLEIYRNRPSTWKNFAERLLITRETIATTLLQLQRAIVNYFQDNKPRSLFQGVLDPEKWEQAKIAANSNFNLPMSAVDEWGLSSETQQNGSHREGFSTNIASVFSLRQNKYFSRSIQEYFSSLSNFFNQGMIVCATNGLIGRNLIKP